MAIKNYSTKVPAAKTVGEIQVILAKHGAFRVSIDYGAGGRVLGPLPRVQRMEGAMSSMEVSPLMQRLRDELDAAGIEWRDASEEFASGGYHYRMERTKAMRDGEELASCIWGYGGPAGHETGMSHGWPDRIESWDPTNRGEDPEPKTVEEIMEAVGQS